MREWESGRVGEWESGRVGETAQYLVQGTNKIPAGMTGCSQF